MKKIFTLFAATLFTVAIFAADRKPVVTVKASKKYELIIDAQSYFSSNNSMNLSNIRSGQHSIKVYEMNNSRFRKFKKLVSASSFQVRNNDVSITVDSRGQISIAEDRFGYDRKNDQVYNGRDNSYGYDKKESRNQDDRDKDHGNNKNDRDKRF
ncbi:MAG: hypothetical protein WDO71_09450 [Bacteroidota bacterium]